MKTILNVNYEMTKGGIETFMINVFRVLNKKEYNFVFLCFGDIDEAYQKEISESGSKIIKIEDKNKTGIIKYIKRMTEIMILEDIDIIHSHIYYGSLFVLIAAIFAKVKIRIVHSHTTREAKNIIQKISWYIAKIFINILSTDKIACSEAAGKKLFYKNFKIVPNGIDIDKFKFNYEKRKKLRNKYNISNEDIIIGHVGRFQEAKNHKFMLEVAAQIIAENKRYKFIFIGDGILLNEMRELSKTLNICNNIIFLKNKNNIYDYYNIFDLFMLPSLYEGLGIVLIEAQINGLQCLASNKVTPEVKISNSVEFLALNQYIWAQKILQLNKERLNDENMLKINCYSVENMVNKIEIIYSRLGDNYE